MNVGEKIKELRIKKGMTQQELGDYLGVKKSAIQKYENGSIQNLKIDTIRRLCELFEVFPEELIYSEELEVTSDSPSNLRLKSEIRLARLLEVIYGNDIVDCLDLITRLDTQSKTKAITYMNDLLLLQELKSQIDKM